VSPRPILVTGATGYIGGRLVPRLLSRGERVRCLARDRLKLAGRPWAGDPRVEIVEGDASLPADLERALAGCGAAYYLIHSMIAAGAAYAAHDRALARGFAVGAAAAGVERIIYLGGLGETGDHLSEHLSSRREVEQALASTRVPVTVLRAAMIIGSGSASFEMLRYLVERLPVMVTPRWVTTECQPIAVDDALRYLTDCLDEPETTGRTLDIGGAEVVTYRELMQATAAALGVRRRVILPLPVLTPRLSSLWIHLVTPLSHRIARPLAEGLRNRVVCRDEEATRLLPGPLLGAREAIERALVATRGHQVDTSWSDAGVIAGDPEWAGGKLFRDRRSITVHAGAATVFGAICRLGGEHGWYAADLLWRLRGALDRLAGGPGLRRGRRDAQMLRHGDALDFWRVVALEPERRLRLRAEMKLPGTAWLELAVEPGPDGTCTVVQTATFAPRGLAGLIYWHALLPVHGIVFAGLLDGIRRASEDRRDVLRGGAPVPAPDAPEAGAAQLASRR
jgi:uncharacterized protein YbjT (DUF2867 family)